MRKDWYKPFLTHLSVSANIRDACAAAGISKQAAYLAKDDDPIFAKAWEECLSDAVDGLKAKLWEWAKEGDLPDKRALAKWLVSIHDPSHRDTPVKVETNVNVDARTQSVELTGLVTADALAKALTLLAEVKAIPAHLNGHAGPGTTAEA